MIIKFAISKEKEESDAIFNEHLAWLAIRIVLEMDIRGGEARKALSMLVKSFL